jgi:hypothetical protein
VHGRHRDDKGEQIVDNCVQKPVKQSLARHMLNRLQSVVNKQLGTHPDKPKSVDDPDQGVEHKTIPAFVLFVHH